jgi:dTDP-4-amino-4,6-dideoxy-D-galactose acyltransferase
VIADDPAYRMLPWDSDFFGVRIAKIDPMGFAEARRAECLNWCREHGVDCAYLFVDSGDQPLLDAAIEHGFRLVDVRVTLKVVPTTTQARPSPARVELRPSRESDIDSLSRIATGAHRDTRFYVDGRFGRDRCDALYELWVAKSCRGWADRVIVAEHAEEAVGYVTCHRSERAGRIGLVGVTPRVRGLGIGHAMIGEALRWFAGEGVVEVSVATQARNIAGLSLYQKSGFAVRSIDCGFHKWFRPHE